MQRHLSLSRFFPHRNDSRARKRLGRKRPTRRLCHEHLEDRSLLAAFLVTNDADSGDGSLRWAISEANNASGPDTIEFASELADKTITLTSELHITDDLTINGLGADRLTISGNNASRIFLVDDGDSNTTITVSISGLSLENGSSRGDGGAIFNKEDLTVKDSTLANNSAQHGGGIHNYYQSTLTVTNSTLANNSADHTGGGIYNSSGTLTVTNSTLADNSARYRGGGIWNSSGTLTVTNSTLAHNSANYGGGIYNWYQSTLTVTNSTLADNSAYYGGGIFTYASTLTVTNSTLANNSADDTGGGIHNNSSTLTVTNSTLANNSANAGGGIWNYSSTLTVTNSTLANNSATYYGGGVYNNSSTLTVTNSTLANNSAYSGGGIFNSGSTLTVTNSTLANNSARFGGGGIYNFRSTLTLNNSLLGGKTASSGPEIFKDATSTITAMHNVIQNGAGSGIVHGDNGNQVGVDPLLDPNGLQDNGGPTQTIALMPGSPAINAGNNALAVDAYGNPLEFDQRGPGFYRFVGTVDIGAFENQQPVAAMLASIQLLFQDGTLNRGQAKSLSVKLLHVQRKLDAGQTHVALNLLGAFSSQVQDFIDDGVLTAEQGQSLLDAADALWTSLTVVADA